MNPNYTYSMEFLTIAIPKVDHRTLVTLSILTVILVLMVALFFIIMQVLLIALVTMTDLNVLRLNKVEGASPEVVLKHGHLHTTTYVRLFDLFSKSSRTVFFVLFCMIGDMLALMIFIMIYPYDHPKHGPGMPMAPNPTISSVTDTTAIPIQG